MFLVRLDNTSKFSTKQTDKTHNEDTKKNKTANENDKHREGFLSLFFLRSLNIIEKESEREKTIYMHVCVCDMNIHDRSIYPIRPLSFYS